MQVEFERTGGLVSRRLAFSTASASLTPEEEQELRGLVQAADFFQQPHAPASPPAGADRFHYRLTIEADGRRHTIEFDDPVSPSLAPLVNWLTAAARRAKRP